VSRPLRIALVTVGGLVLIAFPYLETWPIFGNFLDSFRTFQAAQFGVWLTILLGLNLLTGYSGQISLGHGALVAVGAYIAAILISDLGVPIYLAVPAAGLATGAVGFALGAPALRLTGPYLAISTLALAVALPQMMKLNGVSDWTGGNEGIILDAPQTPATLDGLVSDRQWLYYCSIVPAVILLGLAWNLTRWRIGRALRAIRDTEIGAEQMGINVSLYKMTAFGLSAFYAGIGGALFVFGVGFISPQTFDVTLSITMLVMVVLGGLASMPGSVIAAVLMTFRNDIVDGLAGIGVLEPPGALLPGEQQSPETLRGALYGLMLIATVMLMPRGIASLPAALRRKLPGSRAAAPGPVTQENRPQGRSRYVVEEQEP
jgi:branched-chain amino acid transport system permease protein